MPSFSLGSCSTAHIITSMPAMYRSKRSASPWTAAVFAIARLHPARKLAS